MIDTDLNPTAPRADPLEASLPTSVAARDLSRPRRVQRRYSEEECFANLAMLWRHYGRPPRALRAFAEFSGFALRRTGPERPDEIRVPAARPADDAAHGRRVPMGLRIQVLQRDRFKCAACGNSPATDPACKLHVDHIVQWSRGGKTEPANLRTLCAACNLGRGARAEG